MVRLSQQEQLLLPPHRVQHWWLKLHDLTHPLKAQPQPLQRGPRKRKLKLKPQMQMLSPVRQRALRRLVQQEKVSQRELLALEQV
jgi:hypothetical protein